MASAIKFLHASDLHLDRPISGLKEIPPHLLRPLANAPYVAANRLFDKAIEEQVDFVLLAGDVADLDQGGPRTAAFLLNQFERLADKGIRVYWCSGRVDRPDRWPNAVELPDNVVTFPAPVVERINHIRDGRIVATILGCGYDGKKRSGGEFRADEGDAFPIALTHGELESNANLAMYRIAYWALGGNHRRSVVEKTDSAEKRTSLVVYPGTTQSRRPTENQAYGATLCRVDQQGVVTTTALDLDVVRWSDQAVAVAENIETDDLKNVLADRALKLTGESPECVQLVRWTINPTGDFNPKLRYREFEDDLLAWLRKELGQDVSNAIWSVDLTVQSPKSLPNSWYEEDTILGDYLRSVSRYHSDETIPLGLHELMPATLQDDSLATVSRIDQDRRETLLQRAALVGTEYLSLHHVAEED